MHPDERCLYSVKRTCGRCKGTGQAQFGKQCGVCKGRARQWVQFMAHELTDADLRTLPMGLRARALQECEEHKARNRKAARSAEWLALNGGEPTSDQEREAMRLYVDAA